MTHSTHNPVPAISIPRHNIPLYAIIAAISFIVAMTILIATDNAGPHGPELFVGLAVTTIPSLFAAAFAERVSRDVRNGVVAEQSRVGATKALDETGVIEVVEQTQRGESTAVALAALKELLVQAGESAAERQRRREREDAATAQSEARDAEYRRDENI